MSDTKAVVVAKILLFVLANKRAYPVCQKKHRKKSKPCKKHHSPPTDAVWIGNVSKGLMGEFKEALKEYNKKFNRSMRKWNRQTIIINNKIVAPAYTEWMSKTKEEHLAAKPVYQFSYTERPLGTKL